jgi:hypothetical protein
VHTRSHIRAVFTGVLLLSNHTEIKITNELSAFEERKRRNGKEKRNIPPKT